MKLQGILYALLVTQSAAASISELQLTPDLELKVKIVSELFRNQDAIRNIENNPINRKGGGGGGHGGGGGRGGSGGRGGDGGNGGKGGSSASKGSPKADKDVRGYGNNRLPSYAESETPPPPYSASKGAPPSPEHASTSYGQTGPRSNYWNGQYYPYNQFGYGPTVFPLLPLAVAPLLFVGPFGFYGHYGSHNGDNYDNATVSDLYTNGTSIGNDTLVNGTYYTLSWDSGKYDVMSEQNGTYVGGVDIGNNTYVNGTFLSSFQGPPDSYTVNPNVTANGTMLPSDNSTSTNSANGLAPAMFLMGVSLLL